MVDVETNCLGTIDKDNYLIMSPNYPDEYPHELNCTWKLSAPLGKRVLLHFDNFTTSDGNDFLTIYNGIEDKNKIIASLSGDFAQDIYSTGSKLFLRFTTTKKNDIFRGFSILYEGRHTFLLISRTS